MKESLTLYSLSPYTKIDVSRGAIMTYKEIPTMHVPQGAYGMQLDAVFGGSPDGPFVINPNRSQLGYFAEKNDGKALITQPQETMVEHMNPLAVAYWLTRSADSTNDSVLQVYIKLHEENAETIHSVQLIHRESQWIVANDTTIYSLSDRSIPESVRPLLETVQVLA